MAASKQLEPTLFPVDIDGLVRHYEMIHQNEGIVEDSPLIINQLLDRLGWKVPRLKRKVKTFLELTDNIKIYLKEKEIRIAEELATGAKVKSMDRTEAKYLIEVALSSFDCRIQNRRLKKKDIDTYLGYSTRTMRVQQSIYKDNLSKPGTKENRIYTELRRELESLTAQE